MGHSTEEFLSHVLADEGTFCVVGIRGAGKDKKIVHKYYTSIDPLIHTARSLDGNGYDAYFALSTFHTAGTREASNSDKLKALFLDLDCGEGKGYATQRDALLALREFCTELSLPIPTVVNSGRGIHVYWALTEATPYAEWVVVAERLKAACAQYDLHQDPNVTADGARILRVPGTHNYKTDPLVEVAVLGALRAPVDIQKFADLLPMSAISLVTSYNQGLLQANDNLTGGPRESDKLFRKILRRSREDDGCAHIRNAVDNPNDLNYQQWLDVLSIAKFCKDGEEAIHTVSEGYEFYSAEETEKIAASLEAPHLCTTFDFNCPGVCETCPHFGRIKSPIVLGVVATLAATPAPEEAEAGEAPASIFPATMPEGYAFNADGQLCKIERQANDAEDNKAVVIFPDTFFMLKRLYDPQWGPVAVFRYLTPRDGLKEFSVPATQLGNLEEFRKVMDANRVHIIGSVGEIMSYVRAWLRHLQESIPETNAKKQFGWTDDHKSFVVGDKEYFADRVEYNAPSHATSALFPAFEPKGSLEEWKAQIDFYNRPGFEVHQYMMGLSFGAPLMTFTAVAGGIFHLRSPGSGYGKTTGMIAGSSVWANHSEFMLFAKDTENSVWLRAELYKNLPLYIDELSNKDPKAASDFAYGITSGRQRNRMANSTTNTERQRGKPWALLVGTSGNKSLLQEIQLYKALPEGEIQRVIEKRAVKMMFSPEEKARTDELSDALKNNYGWAGPIFIQYVLQHMDYVKETIKKMRKSLDRAAGLSSSNRVWSAQATCVLVGLMLAQQAGLLNFDLKNLFNWVVKELQKSQQDLDRLQLRPEDTVAQFFADHYRNILIVKSDDKQFKDPTNLLNSVPPDSVPNGQWVGRYERDDQRLYIMTKPFKFWCGKRQIDYEWVVEMLESSMGAKISRERLGKGTKVNIPPMECIVVSWEHEEDDEVQTPVAFGA